jgi:ribosomal protein S18 acetylase RimI-like enzyme
MKTSFPNNIQIIALDKTQFKNNSLHFEYTTDGYYDILRDPDALFSIHLVKKSFAEEIHKEFTDQLYEDYLEDPAAFALQSSNQTLGYLEIAQERWHNRLRVTELLILPGYRGKGYGSMLMDHAKEIGRVENVRELVLETQSCNIKAIGFYVKQGFIVNGIDLSAYSSEDVEKKEVRLEMVCRL